MSRVMVVAKEELMVRANVGVGDRDCLGVQPPSSLFSQDPPHRPSKLLISHSPLAAGPPPSAGDPSHINLSSLLSASSTTMD